MAVAVGPSSIYLLGGASKRSSLVCTRQPLAPRPKTPSSGHLVPTIGGRSIPSADKVFFHFECLWELREWRHSPLPLSIFDVFPRQTMRALRPGNQICRKIWERERGWRFFSANAKVVRDFCGSGHWNLAADADVLVATQLDHSSFFFRNNFPSVVQFFLLGQLQLTRKSLNREMDTRWGPGEQDGLLKKKFLRGVDGTRWRGWRWSVCRCKCEKLDIWHTLYKRLLFLLFRPRKRPQHKNLQNKETSAAVP